MCPHETPRLLSEGGEMGVRVRVEEVSTAWTSNGSATHPFLFWAMPRSLWDPSSPTRDRPGALSSESAESQSPDCQGTPQGGKEGFPRRRWRHRRDPRAEKEPSVAENEGAAAGKTLWSGGMGGLAQRAEDSSHELPADTFWLHSTEDGGPCAAPWAGTDLIRAQCFLLGPRSFHR